MGDYPPCAGCASLQVDMPLQASDSDGSIAKVKLLINNASVGVDTSSPYSWNSSSNSALNNLAAGNYTLKAIATDDDGATATTSINIKITSSNPTTSSYICTKVNDNLDPYDYTYMIQKLNGLGLKKDTTDGNVSTSAFKTYFNKHVKFLYHTGHGSPGSIATSNGSFGTGDISKIAIENTFIATCLTLKSTT